MKYNRVIYLLIAAVLTLDVSGQEVITGLSATVSLLMLSDQHIT